MKLCDRCRVSGCCLTYLGEACERARKRECPDVVYTNSDKIGDMTYEEKLEFFERVSRCAGCPPGTNFECQDSCYRCWSEYLLSPVEED